MLRNFKRADNLEQHIILWGCIIVNLFFGETLYIKEIRRINSLERKTPVTL